MVSFKLPPIAPATLVYIHTCYVISLKAQDAPSPVCGENDGWMLAIFKSFRKGARERARWIKTFATQASCHESNLQIPRWEKRTDS